MTKITIEKKMLDEAGLRLKVATEVMEIMFKALRKIHKEAGELDQEGVEAVSLKAIQDAARLINESGLG